MKLRKALEKAKSELPAGIQMDGTSGRPLDISERRNEVPFNEWTPPDYTQSQIQPLDKKVLVENHCVGFFSESSEIDFYKVLRSQIQQRLKEKNWNTLMITSVNPAEGKSLTAINLGLTFAKEFHKTVLLVDCDLKKQDVHSIMGVDGEKGLADYLVDDVALNELITWPQIDKFTLISGGRTIQDSAELLGSPKMRHLVEEMKNRYDDRFVLFDAPSVLQNADAIALAPFVDGIIMIVEAGKTSTMDVKRALELIPMEKFIGFVLNRDQTVQPPH